MKTENTLLEKFKHDLLDTSQNDEDIVGKSYEKSQKNIIKKNKHIFNHHYDVHKFLLVSFVC